MEDFAGELRTVIHGDGLWQAMRFGQVFQHHDDAMATDAVIGPEGWALAGEVIHDGQRAKPATIGQLVMDEVHAPAFIWSCG